MTEVALVATRTPVVLPARATSGSIGYDLSNVEEVTIEPGAVTIVPTGFKLGQPLPKITEDRFAACALAMLVLPRSSLALKYGLTVVNSPGLIDTDYAGEIGLLLHNFRQTPIMIPAATRLAQAVFVICQLPDVFQVDEQNPTMVRGGFGHTGTGKV